MSSETGRLARQLRPRRLTVCLAGALALAAPSARSADVVFPGVLIQPDFVASSPFSPGFLSAPPRTAAWLHASGPFAAAHNCGAVNAKDLPCSRVSLATGTTAISRNSVAIANPPGPASTFIVSSCGDSSAAGAAGELRYEVTKAASGDTIDMTGLTCGSIILYFGAIAIPQNALYLHGPGPDKLAITGAFAYQAYEQDRILNHTGNGLLTVRGLSFSYGAPYSKSATVAGGCIASSGSVDLEYSVVSHCTAKTNGSNLGAIGGGIYVKANFTLSYSVVTNNRALATGSTSIAAGGGAAAHSYLRCDHCSIGSNQASGTKYGIGGGAYSGGNAIFVYSTISGNRASAFGGGIVAAGNTPFELFESTVSGNNAGQRVGGVYALTNTGVYYSTIAFNTVTSATSQPSRAPGLAVGTTGSALTATLNDSLLSNNTYGAGIENDFSTFARSGSATVTVGGGYDLIRTTFSAVPSHTITGACPDLGPLRNDGGFTPTHALMSLSPAIARGGFSSPHIPTYDQRGPGYPRISASAPHGIGPFVPDLGAYEVQQNDIIFNNGFDGCP